MSPLASLVLALPVLAQAPESSTTTAIQAAVEQFQHQQGGDWVVQWNPATGTPGTIYGTGITIPDWRENTLEEARRHALRALDQHAAMLGIGDSNFVEVIGARMGRAWSFTFDQFYRGLPVIEGRVDVRINGKGVIAMLGSRAWQIPTNFGVTPAIADDVATAITWEHLGETPTGVLQPRRTPAPRLVIWGDSLATAATPVHLAWEVAISNVDRNGQGRIGRQYIDAQTGAPLSYVTDKHDCGIPGCGIRSGGTRLAGAAAVPPVPTTVTVMAWTNTTVDATFPLVNTPLVGLTLSVPGVGTVTTDGNGQFTVDIAAAVNISVGALDGTHFGPIGGSNGISGSFTINPGVNSTIQLLTSGASSLQAAHPNTAYWVDRANTWVRTIVGNSSQMNTADAVTSTVNIVTANACNAYYIGNTINFYAAGNGCSNTAFSTVIVHEWGHGLDERYGGISNNTGDGLSEGWGDIFGLYLLDTPNLGQGFSSPGSPLRSGNNTKMYGTQSEIHNAGEIWMGFAWKYRQNLRTAFGTPTAIQVSDETVIASIVADATNQADAVTQVFLADDDDGNLLNGVPHYAQLSAAAIAKGMPYPEVQLMSVAHTPLVSTTQALVPRVVSANVQTIQGSVNAMRLHFNAGSGNVIRPLAASSAANTFLALLPGIENGNVSYHLEFDHSSGTTFRVPETGEYTYSVTVGSFAGFLLETFEGSTAGWVNGAYSGTNEWAVGVPLGKSGISSGVAWQDPSNTPSGTRCYGVDLGTTTNGRYVGNSNTYLRSPVFNCTGRSGVRVRFKRWLSVEEGVFDQATLYMNGAQVWTNDPNVNTQDTSWQTVDYLVPAADNNAAVQFEWRLTTDGALHMGGWHIDDFELGETILPTYDAKLSILPEQAQSGALLTFRVETPGNARPYLLALGDTVGPIIVPGFPILITNASLGVAGGVTNAAGIDTFGGAAPTVPSAVGMLLYSQVLTVDATFTNFVASNRFLNLFTQ